ncbi:cobalt transport protein CbiN [Moorella thermoacetica]|uniref:energy-coupling factor ABC transporter substrate-binding protein n=1 Tax=Neomoorella thermoacetica TaxID=1525 RepID=UPI00069CD2B3|nr:energy-coupling factor ABC transporter substrate-binding protein [Moorella thermoacetica]AKX93994.1 cobalt transport protein CbiN [Moorella thermoacetica]
MSTAHKNFLLLLMVILLAAVPFLIHRSAEFAGADDRAAEAITQIRPDYKPWVKPVWEPPSGEVETFLFASQAAIGSGIVCYFLGYSKGKKQQESK